MKKVYYFLMSLLLLIVGMLSNTFALPSINYYELHYEFEANNQEYYRFFTTSLYSTNLSYNLAKKDIKRKDKNYVDVLEVLYEGEKVYAPIIDKKAIKDKCATINDDNKKLIEAYPDANGLKNVDDYKFIGYPEDNGAIECFNYNGDIHVLEYDKNNPSSIFQDMEFLLNNKQLIRSYLNDLPYKENLTKEQNKKNLRKYYSNNLEYYKDYKKIDDGGGINFKNDIFTLQGFIEEKKAVCQSFAIGLGFVYNYYDLGDFQYVKGTAKELWGDMGEKHGLLKDRTNNHYYDITWQLENSSPYVFYNMNDEQLGGYVTLLGNEVLPVTTELLIRNNDKMPWVWAVMGRQKELTAQKLLDQIGAVAESYDNFEDIKKFLSIRFNNLYNRYGTRFSDIQDPNNLAELLSRVERDYDGKKIEFENAKLIDHIKDEYGQSSKERNVESVRNDVESFKDSMENIAETLKKETYVNKKLNNLNQKERAIYNKLRSLTIKYASRVKVSQRKMFFRKLKEKIEKLNNGIGGHNSLEAFLVDLGYVV